MWVASRDSNVVNCLTYRYSANVQILEFFVRPFDPSAIPFNVDPFYGRGMKTTYFALRSTG